MWGYSPPASFARSADDAFTGGIDYNLRWDQNRVNWNGHWVATRAPGDNGVRTSGGGVTNFNVSRKYWNVFSHFDHFGRDFRVTDIGFFRTRADRYDVDGGLNVEQPDPGKRFRRYGGNICGGRGWNNDGLVYRDVALYQRERHVPQLLERQWRRDTPVRSL